MLACVKSQRRENQVLKLEILLSILFKMITFASIFSDIKKSYERNKRRIEMKTLKTLVWRIFRCRQNFPNVNLSLNDIKGMRRENSLFALMLRTPEGG